MGTYDDEIAKYTAEIDKFDEQIQELKQQKFHAQTELNSLKRMQHGYYIGRCAYSNGSMKYNMYGYIGKTSREDAEKAVISFANRDYHYTDDREVIKITPEKAQRFRLLRDLCYICGCLMGSLHECNSLEFGINFEKLESAKINIKRELGIADDDAISPTTWFIG